jgi:hypothetical protein
VQSGPDRLVDRGFFVGAKRSRVECKWSRWVSILFSRSFSFNPADGADQDVSAALAAEIAVVEPGYRG